VTEDGEVLGTLKEVRSAATDVYTMEQNGKEILFPVADGVVLGVDVEGKKITVSRKRFYEVAVL
jgi:ribosomal 30S subunit maturation factor RimM